MLQRARFAIGQHGALAADCVLGAVVAVVVAVAIGADLGGHRAPDAPAYLFALCLGALMLVRRPFPVLVLVATGAGLIAYYSAGYPPIGLAIPVVAALYSAGEAGKVAWAAATALALLAVSTIYRLLVGQSPAYLLGYELASSVALMAGAIAFGYSMRARRLLYAQQRAQRARAALDREREGRRRVEQERLRIARDIHDILAHTIAVISVQANLASDTLPDDPQATRAALAAIRTASDEAAREMRSTLGLLGADPSSRSPTGSLRQLDTLARATSGSGLPVSIRVEGQPPRVPAAVDATAYRIVREALTNSLRHAQASHVEIVVRHEPGRLDVRVHDDGCGASSEQAQRAPEPAPTDVNGGWGIAGMRQRAALLGGSLDTGPSPDGGFVVHASLPLDLP